jgi:chemotaxis protein CheZ
MAHRCKNLALSPPPLQHLWSFLGGSMPIQRKVFRIEQMMPLATPSALWSGAASARTPQREILAELQALRTLIEQNPGGMTHDDRSPAAGGELHRLKQEAKNLHRAIEQTRQDLAMLQARAFNHEGPAYVARQLDAVAEGTECATQRILDAAEDIEDAADTLAGSLQREQERAVAHDIRDYAVRIFEACNFQDLSGQRINKAIATLKFVERRIAHMAAILERPESLNPSTAVTAGERVPPATTLEGPKLDGDVGHATQADVDKMFTPD